MAREFTVKDVSKKEVTFKAKDGGEEVKLPCTTDAAQEHWRARKEKGDTVLLDQ